MSSRHGMASPTRGARSSDDVHGPRPACCTSARIAQTARPLPASWLAATGADASDQVHAAAIRPALARLELLVITVITPETEQVLPAAEMPGLRSQMNDALLELIYDDR